MYRRTLLAAVCALSGCTGAVPNPFGGGSGSNGGEAGGSGGGASADEQSSPAGTATTTASPTDPTATATPSADDLRRMSVPDLLAIAREQFGAAVSAYAGEGAPLTDVTARSSSFDPVPVITHLFHARRAYEAANRQGISGAQEAEIQELRRLEAALRLLIDVQVLLTEAHDDLDAIVTAIRFVDAQTVSSLTGRVASRQERAAESIATLSSSQYEASVSAVAALSKRAFVEKRLQLAAETTVLGEINAAFPTVLEGVKLFAEARGARTSGSPYAAAALSRDAAAALGRGATDIRTAVDSIPPRGRGFQPVGAELVSVTTATRDEAKAFADSVEL